MRVKTGFARKRAHKKIQLANKGYRMTKKKLVKVAKEAYVHAGQYAYNGRKEKKQNYRQLWIYRISGALKDSGYSYSKFINLIKEKNIYLDRKMMAEIIQDDPQSFQKLIEELK